MLRAVGLRGPRAVEVTGRRIGRYPPEIESAVYYRCLEALHNATKHAGPSAHIAAHLTADNRELRLEVSDDGPGFDVAKVPTLDRIGKPMPIVKMRYRRASRAAIGHRISKPKSRCGPRSSWRRWP
jgi:signal transduction histidine kinase